MDRRATVAGSFESRITNNESRIIMRIIFLGQLGLPLLATAEEASCEKRAADLAKALATLGHTVVLTGTAPYVVGSGMNYHGVRVQRLASLNPQHPGGWIYTLLGILVSWKFQPSVAHLQGWQTASLARLLYLGNRTVTLVWTIDSIAKLPAWVARWIVAGVDEVTVPTRALQYKLLNQYGIRAAYIPDGYTESSLPLLSPRHFGVRVSNYAVVVADTPARVRQVAMAYLQTGTRRKLVVLQPAVRAYKRLANKHRFLQFLGPLQGRARHSLFAQADVVILDGQVSPQVVLETMAAGKLIIAATHALYQELCGTTAMFYAVQDSDGLVAALRQISDGSAKRDTLARAACKRARTHFQTTRILAEYLVAYQSYRQVVALDSAHSTSFTQLSIS